MDTFAFEAIGTKWSIVVDGNELQEKTRSTILDTIDVFDKRFSRFIVSSEANAFRDAAPGSYELSKDFGRILNDADRLRMLTGGGFDPAVGALFEKLGYDNRYVLNPDATLDDIRVPEWSIEGVRLTIDGPVVFDIGGTGKGTCIDLVAHIMTQSGYRNFLIEAGGDMYGSTKESGEPWRVAVEYPGKEGVAAGTVSLCNQALAVSDSFRRRWGKWHHLINPHTKSTVDAILGAAAVAPSAYEADAMTSGIFFGTPDMYDTIKHAYGAEYLIFHPDNMVTMSVGWMQ